MSRSSSSPPRGRRPVWLIAAVVALFAAAGLTALAAAHTSKKRKPLVKTAHNAALKATILVDANGKTLYELKPETAKHLLCTSSTCLDVWPPAKLGRHVKLVKSKDVKGRLGRLHRRGFDQLTLDGRPLYRFSGDSRKGSAAGQGLMSFGGTWHVVKESRSSSGTTTTTTTTSTTTSSSPYSYPGY